LTEPQAQVGAPELEDLDQLLCPPPFAAMFRRCVVTTRALAVGV